MQFSIITNNELWTKNYFALCLTETDSGGWGSTVIIATRLWAQQFRVWNPVGARDVCLLQNTQTSSVIHPASYSKRLRGTLVRVKQTRPEADHSPPTSVKVGNDWNCTSAKPLCLQEVDMESITLVYRWQRRAFWGWRDMWERVGQNLFFQPISMGIWTLLCEQHLCEFTGNGMSKKAVMYVGCWLVVMSKGMNVMLRRNGKKMQQ